MDEFYRTRMGHQFFNSTMPKIAEELERLNQNLEALVSALGRPPREDGQTTGPVVSEGVDPKSVT